MNRRSVILVVMLIALAGCCPWADWQPCRALVTVQDQNGQPIDASVVLINRATFKEVTRTDCPGSCIVELPDLFHNGEWSSTDGFIIHAEAAGKQPLENEFVCYWEGMMWMDGGLVNEAVAFVLID